MRGARNPPGGGQGSGQGSDLGAVLVGSCANSARCAPLQSEDGPGICGWVRQCILFHNRKHPSEMGAAEVASFLSSLATEGAVSASTQNHALASVLLLYSQVLGRSV
jgi:hypothetical protein